MNRLEKNKETDQPEQNKGISKRVVSRRFFVKIAAALVLSPNLMSNSQASDQHHGISEDRKEELFGEQKEGYGKSRKLSGSFAIDLSDAEPKIAPVGELVKMYGGEQVEKALKGGRLIILCSDDRVGPPPDEEGQEAWVKFGIPGSGALVPKASRPGFFSRLKNKIGRKLKATSHHEKCGACEGDLELAKSVGEEAHLALGSGLPHVVSGYSEIENDR
jgi:hypothetical protein